MRTEKQIKALDDLTASAKKKAKIEYMDDRYNPENIQKKLSKQVDDVTGGQASKVREATMKDQKKNNQIKLKREHLWKIPKVLSFSNFIFAILKATYFKMTRISIVHSLFAC